MEKLLIQDIIAIIIIVLGLIFIAAGKDSFIQYVVAAVVGYYFGRRRELADRIKK